MPQKKSSATDDAAWARAFRDALAAGRAPTGEGWILARDLQKRLGLGHVKFYKAVRAMRAAGTVEVFDGHQHSDGRWLRAVWYRLC